MPDILSGILQGIQLGQQRQAVQAKQKLDEQTQADANSKEMEKVKQEQDRINQQRKEFDATHEINLANLELNKKAAHLKMMAEEAALNPNLQAELEQAKQGPILKRETTRDEAESQRRLGELSLRQGYASQEQRVADEQAMKREKYRGGIDLAVAGMRSQVDTAVDMDNITNYVHGLADGTYTQEDIKSQAGPKGALRIFGVANKAGIVPLRKAQNDELANLPYLATTVRLVDQFLTAQPDVGEGFLPVKLTGAIKQTDTKLKGLENQVSAQALMAAQIIAKTSSRSLSDSDRKAFTAGQLPSLMNSKKNNIKLRDDMLKATKNLFESVTGNMSKEQRALISERLGLDEVLGNKPTASQPTKGSTKDVNWVLGPDGKLVQSSGGQ